MKTLLSIRPRTIIAISLALTVLMVGTAIIELMQSRSELFQLLRDQATALAASIEHSSRNIVRSTDRIEEGLAERLLNNAYFIARLDSAGTLTQADLQRICSANQIFRINVFDRRGRRVVGNINPLEEHAGRSPLHTPAAMLAPILRGSADHLVIGLKESRFGEGQRFAVAVRRTGRHAGAIALNLNADQLTELRKSIGIGRLMKDLVDNPGIEYAVLQDRQGIIAANGQVQEMTAIETEPQIRSALSSDTTLTRVTSVAGREVFEVIRPFRLGEDLNGVLRIGLSMDPVRSAETRMQRRVLVMSIITLVIGALVMTVIVAGQNVRLAQERIHRVETFTGNVLAEMRDAVVVVDQRSVVTIFNRRAEEFFGLTADRVVGRRADALFQGPYATLAEALREAAAVCELAVLLPDGVRTISVSVSENRTARGEIESRTAVIRDLTEQRRLQDELQRKERFSAMGELAASVAHEIRNPLNAIVMIGQRFEKEFRPVRGVREYRKITDVLIRESRRVNSIIEQFLRFARPPRLHPRPVDLAGWISDISTLFIGDARAKHVRFTAEQGEGQCVFDRDLMTQVVLNVLRNALEATPRGGTIRLTPSVTPEELVIIVADSGSGIAPDVFPKIFDPYFTTKSDGTGLGLPIAHQIVTRHGGEITLESTEGAGTTVTIRLPLSSPSTA